ncbi:phosphatidylserine decarboxylase [Kaarinaea lacus]
MHISIGFLIAIPFWIATLVLCILFRDPKREIPPKPLAVVSPVDGKVTSIDTVDDPYTTTPVVQIQLKKGFFDIMTARSPMEGKILKQWFGTVVDTKGLVSGISTVKAEQTVPQSCEMAADSVSVGSQATICRFAQWIQSDEQDNVVMAVISATSFFKPRCYSHSGDRIGQGQRCGFIPFAAVVHVSVPVSSRLEVKIGDTVHGGSDTLATLVH